MYGHVTKGHGLVMAFRRPKVIAGVNDLEGLFKCMLVSDSTFNL